VLDKLSLNMAWRVKLPTEGARDGFASIQLAPPMPYQTSFLLEEADKGATTLRVFKLVNTPSVERNVGNTDYVLDVAVINGDIANPYPIAHGSTRTKLTLTAGTTAKFGEGSIVQIYSCPAILFVQTYGGMYTPSTGDGQPPVEHAARHALPAVPTGRLQLVQRVRRPQGEALHPQPAHRHATPLSAGKEHQRSAVRHGPGTAPLHRTGRG